VRILKSAGHWVDAPPECGPIKTLDDRHLYEFLIRGAPAPNGALIRFRMRVRALRRFPMADIVYLFLGVAFFGLTALYAAACARL